MGDMVFYDIHCHAINMSHPCMMAFVSRCARALRELTAMELIKSAGALTRIKIIREIFDFLGSIRETQNLLSVMENDICSLFLIMEDCLLGKYGFSPPLVENGVLRIGGNSYNKIILTPLMMDFGHKGALPFGGAYYNRPSRKPLTEQVFDVFNGIRHYLKKSEYKLFEIYPFWGLNTKNYTLEKIKELLDKYFGGYSGKKEDLYSNFGKFDGNIENLSSDYFAGIKVYPPLGFDPWPKDDPAEFEKVNYLYSYCCDKNIPITAHCNDEGFVVCDPKDALAFTSPERWSEVLADHPRLKLNLAHFGRQAENACGDWSVKICALVLKYENVYADFAFNGTDPAYYEVLRKFIDRSPLEVREKLGRRILFGSDFMMNLLKIESYSKYLSHYSQTPHFNDAEKRRFCSLNPGEFLFGEFSAN